MTDHPDLCSIILILLFECVGQKLCGKTGNLIEVRKGRKMVSKKERENEVRI